MWRLYIVRHPRGDFIGVAETESQAREHWGECKLIQISNSEQLANHMSAFRRDHKEPLIFLAY